MEERKKIRYYTMADYEAGKCDIHGKPLNKDMAKPAVKVEPLNEERMPVQPPVEEPGGPRVAEEKPKKRARRKKRGPDAGKPVADKPPAEPPMGG